MPKLPTRQEMLTAIEHTRDAGQLIAVFENRYALKQAIKEDARKKRMIGGANYNMPNLSTLKKTLNKNNEELNVQFVERLANNVEPMQGMIFNMDYHRSRIRKAPVDPV